MAQATPSGLFGVENPSVLSTSTSPSSLTPGPPTPASTAQNANPAPSLPNSNPSGLQSTSSTTASNTNAQNAGRRILNPVPIRSSSAFTTQNGGASGVARSAHPEVVFDQRGDLRLEVKADIIGGVQFTKIFVVSSRAMSSACDAWYAMLNGPFRESQAAESSSDTGRVIPFLDDDASSMAILLNIAHLRFKEVPPFLTFGQLVKLTRLTDKYGATHLLRPWAKSWISQNESVLVAAGYESWLWIAWELGQVSMFERLVSHLVKTVRIQGGKCYVGGRMLDPLSPGSHLPPDIIESIFKEREKTIAQMLNLLYAAIDQYIYPGLQNQRVCGIECDAMALGSVVLSLKKAGLRVEKMKVAELPLSVNELFSKLNGIQVCRAVNHQAFTACGNGLICAELKKSILTIVETIPSAVQETHRRHLERQSAIIN
ncbi:hypothetical protein IWX90DRAFT_311368 [Phyllosticta citrichinensis]|uniref:Nuclear pore protein n=1 Tax=Phyllosticta citrichinensis TaxID=1130410 RepID=A0ABR1XMC0_9PEZI